MQALIRGLPFGVFLFMLAVLLAMAAVAFSPAFRRDVRRVKSMPTSNTGMAAAGYVEVEGRIEAVDGATLIAPLTREFGLANRAIELHRRTS